MNRPPSHPARDNYVTVVINGTEHSVPTDSPDAAPLVDVLDVAGVARDARGVAVAVDAEVIGRGEWEETEVSPGASIEIITAAQGG